SVRSARETTGNAVIGTSRGDDAPRRRGSSITTGTRTGSEATVGLRMWLCSVVPTTSSWRDRTTVAVAGSTRRGRARRRKRPEHTRHRSTAARQTLRLGRGSVDTKVGVLAAAAWGHKGEEKRPAAPARSATFFLALF